MGPFKDEMCCEQAEDDEIDAVQYETVKYDTFIKIPTWVFSPVSSWSFQRLCNQFVRAGRISARLLFV